MMHERVLITTFSSLMGVLTPRQQAIQEPPIAQAAQPPTFDLEDELKYIVGAETAKEQVTPPLWCPRVGEGCH